MASCWQLVLLSLLLATTQSKVSRAAEVTSQSTCHQDRIGNLEPARFGRVACVHCYRFLWPREKRYVPLPPLFEHLVRLNGSSVLSTSALSVDPANETAMARVCAASLSNAECARWRACCSAAVKCCDSQLREPRSDDDDDDTYCARTWDGYRCWWETSAGEVATTSCPAFVEHSITTRRAVKRCTLNGTWYEKNGMAWTDYTACLDRESYMVGVYICMACSSFSIILLLPAVVIFLIFRDLYKQHRVRLHINFFLALTLQGVASILWYGMVHYDLFVHTTSTSTVLHRNPLWCRLLSFFKIYFASATYFWMFCEGYFLHRLISKAFEPPKTLIWLFLFGWGMPLIPAVIYAIVRGSIANDSCWAISVGVYEWIVYAPNLFCLVVNLLFLSNILRILLFQLHSHPHEPSNFRRGLKAAFMLIPLFGLQLFLTIYRPPSGSPGQKEYEYVTFLVTCSQGIFVSLIFCFFNGEVLAHFRDVFPCLRRSRRDHCHSTTQMTQMSMTMVDDGKSPQLSPMRHRTSKQNANMEMRPLANNDHSSNNKTNGTSTKDGYRQVPIIVEDGDLL